MRHEFMGEEASLTTLFGDELENDIASIAIEEGLPVSVIKRAVLEYAPELLGIDAREIPVADAITATESTTSKAENVANVLSTILKAGQEVAPGIVAAIKGQKLPQSSGSSSTTTDFNPMSLILPAGLAALVLFLIMKK